jgi:catechol 2,3-dioxygenase-like lactoylglutathione lyase family enzyme
VTHQPARPRARQIHHVVINVRDLDASLAFYRDALGLQHDGTAPVAADGGLSPLVRVPPGSRGRVAFLSAGRGMGRIELVEWQGTAPSEPPQLAAPDRRRGDRPGIAIVSFLLREDELREMYELVHRDRACWSEPVSFDVAGRVLTAFVVEDPDGNAVEFFSLPG